MTSAASVIGTAKASIHNGAEVALPLLSPLSYWGSVCKASAG
jgi:hypothetical protein